MADHDGFRRVAFLAFVALAGLAGCTQSTADFGRQRASSVSPQPNAVLRVASGASSDSEFNLTDAEREMAARTWVFTAAPHRRTQRAVISGEKRTDRESYYRWLQGTEFASSAVRFRRIEADIEADLTLLPGAFEAVCAVQDVDRQRRLALSDIAPADPRVGREVQARAEQNEAAIAAFAHGLAARADAYGHAIDRLLIETPHPEARAADEALSKLETHVSAAAGGRFCGAAQAHDDPQPRRLLSAS